MLLGGALTDGGSLISWLQQLLGTKILKTIIADLDVIIKTGDVKFISTSPFTLPFWSGERSTGWHTDAKGVSKR